VSFCTKCGRGDVKAFDNVNPQFWINQSVGDVYDGWELAGKFEIPAPNGYDGDYNQGDTFDLWIVLKALSGVAAGTFYKFYGSMDSYGSQQWTKVATEVKAKEKKVTVYEFS